MKPGVGKLGVFPSIWGREYILILWIFSRIKADSILQTGPEAPEIARRMSHGWISR
jgi:hypothetical protein